MCRYSQQLFLVFLKWMHITHTTNNIFYNFALFVVFLGISYQSNAFTQWPYCFLKNVNICNCLFYFALVSNFTMFLYVKWPLGDLSSAVLTHCAHRNLRMYCSLNKVNTNCDPILHLALLTISIFNLINYDLKSFVLNVEQMSRLENIHK